MLKQTSDGIWQSSLLLSAKGIVHGYSSRHLGDMRKREPKAAFCSLLKLKTSQLVQPEQIHSNTIGVVGDNGGNIVAGVDGLVYKGKAPIVLGILVADCVPILAVDPATSIVGVAHAGWKGTLGNIAKNLIDTMKKVGDDDKRVLVSIGPHIGMCCYSVPKDRADQFAQAFNNDTRVISRLDGQMHLDLGYANMRQLLGAGIPADHIDVAVSCTSCQVDTFYSFRKDTQETFGEILGVIGFGV